MTLQKYKKRIKTSVQDVENKNRKAAAPQLSMQRQIIRPTGSQDKSLKTGLMWSLLVPVEPSKD